MQNLETQPEGDEDIPTPPPSDPEVHDQPLGVPDDADADDADLPGMPEKEPPATD